MLTKEQNELLTNTNPGAPAGELLRRYWHPIALANELPEGGAPLAVKIMGEELTLFRDEHGRIGLLGLLCSHRGADLSYGRIEDGGIRCLYHGWLYDVNGACLEQPGEPEGSRFAEKVRQTAYPCVEVADIVFTYMGPGEPPLIPLYEAFTVPDSFRLSSKSYSECNYLQANEGNIDPVHLSFLHKFIDVGYVQARRPEKETTVRGGGDTSFRVFGNTAPVIEEHETTFGLRIPDRRQVDETKGYVRQRNFIMPNASAVPGGLRDDGHLIIWYTPIDNESHWRFTLGYSRETAMDDKAQRSLGGQVDDNYRSLANKRNRYNQDREEMKTKTFTGMGSVFTAHDMFATETPGPIYDRTREHLGYTDKAIAAARRMLTDNIRKVEAGQDPVGVIRDPEANWFPDMVIVSEVLPLEVDWSGYWKTAFEAQQSRALVPYEQSHAEWLRSAL